MDLAAQPTSAPRNRLLAALPPNDLARLWPQLEAVELPLRKVLHAPGDPIEVVYFPETGWASMLAYLEDGDAAEVGLAGKDGMVGLPILLGADHDDIEAMVQAPGTALRMDAQAFHEELERNPRLPHAAAALRPRPSRAGGAHRGLQRAPPHRPAPRALAADGARPGRGRRVPDDPRVPVHDARGASGRDHHHRGHAPEGGLHPLPAGPG